MVKFCKALTVILIIGLLGLSFYHLRPYIYIAPAEAANGEELSQKANTPDLKHKNPILVELFTSQSCYSCPPAEAYLRDLAVRPDIIAIEYHVDYWNDLRHGFAGKWRDPYSSPSFTRRQSVYNATIRKRDQNYTPQMVINGRFEGTGSKRPLIENLIEDAKSDQNNIALHPEWEDGYLTVSIEGQRPRLSEINYVMFHKRTATDITAGENKGKKLTSYNVVHTLGVFPTYHSYIEIPKPEAGDHCAVFLQDKNTLEIYASALCPPN